MGENSSDRSLASVVLAVLAMAGVDLRRIQELGGWIELEMLQRYAHLSSGDSAEAVEKIAVHFTTLFITPEKSPSETPDPNN